jgi:hypothetical protein
VQQVGRPLKYESFSSKVSEIEAEIIIIIIIKKVRHKTKQGNTINEIMIACRGEDMASCMVR